MDFNHFGQASFFGVHAAENLQNGLLQELTLPSRTDPAWFLEARCEALYKRTSVFLVSNTWPRFVTIAVAVKSSCVVVDISRIGVTGAPTVEAEGLGLVRGVATLPTAADVRRKLVGLGGSTG